MACLHIAQVYPPMIIFKLFMVIILNAKQMLCYHHIILLGGGNDEKNCIYSVQMQLISLNFPNVPLAESMDLEATGTNC